MLASVVIKDMLFQIILALCQRPLNIIIQDCLKYGICGIYNSKLGKSNTFIYILAFGTAGVIIFGYFMGAGFKAIAKGKDGSTIWYNFIISFLGGFLAAGSLLSYLDFKKEEK